MAAKTRNEADGCGSGPEEVGHSRTLLIKVTLINFSYLNRLALSTFTEVGPQFSTRLNLIRLGPVIEKAKKLSSYLATSKIN